MLNSIKQRVIRAMLCLHMRCVLHGTQAEGGGLSTRRIEKNMNGLLAKVTEKVLNTLTPNSLTLRLKALAFAGVMSRIKVPTTPQINACGIAAKVMG